MDKKPPLVNTHYQHRFIYESDLYIGSNAIAKATLDWTVNNHVINGSAPFPRLPLGHPSNYKWLDMRKRTKMTFSKSVKYDYLPPFQDFRTLAEGTKKQIYEAVNVLRPKNSKQYYFQDSRSKAELAKVVEWPYEKMCVFHPQHIDR